MGGIDIILGGDICRKDACALSVALRNTGGVSQVALLTEIFAPVDHGMLVFLGGRSCERDASELRRWFHIYVQVGTRCPVIRTWPLLIISPHAQRIIRDLHDSTGVDLFLEHHCQVVQLEHSLSNAEDRLCETPAPIREVVEAFQQLLLDNPWRQVTEAVQIRSAANYRQTLSVLSAAVEALHDHAHATLSGNPKGIALEELNSFGATLSLFIAEPILATLRRAGLLAVEGMSPLEQFDALAELLEESRAHLQLIVETAPPVKRWAVFVIDDDQELAANMRAAAPDTASVIGVELPQELAKEVAQTMSCGGDPSEVVAVAVMESLADHLAAYGPARERMQRTSVFVVVDVRLHFHAPLAGVSLMRKVRDQFPAVTIIATTVRRHLADTLADEGVDAYVVKTGTSSDTAAQLWETIKSLASADRLVAFAEAARPLKEDLLLKRLVFECCQMNESDLLARPAVLFITAADIDKARPLLAESTVVVFIEYGVRSDSVLEILRRTKRFGADQTIILRRTPNGTNAQHAVMPSSIARLATTLAAKPIAKHDVAWSILVPKTAHGGELNVAVGEERLASFRTMVSRWFGGATMNSVDGVWLRAIDGREVRDGLERIEVWGRRTHSSWRYMVDVAEKVAKEMRQDEVFVQERSIATWEVRQGISLPSAVDAGSDGRLSIDFVFNHRRDGDADNADNN